MQGACGKGDQPEGAAASSSTAPRLGQAAPHLAVSEGTKRYIDKTRLQGPRDPHHCSRRPVHLTAPYCCPYGVSALASAALASCPPPCAPRHPGRPQPSAPQTPPPFTATGPPPPAHLAQMAWGIISPKNRTNVTLSTMAAAGCISWSRKTGKVSIAAELSSRRVTSSQCVFFTTGRMAVAYTRSCGRHGARRCGFVRP